MDKFDIHKWQRKALLHEDTSNEDTVLDFNKRFKTNFQLEEELKGAFDELKGCLQNMSLDDDQNKYLTKQLAHHYNSILLQEREHTNADFDVEELSQALESEFDEEIEAYIQRGKRGVLKDLVTAIELKTGIDIPDNEAEAQQISKEDLLTLGKTLQDLNTTLEERKSRPPTAGDIVGTLGLLSTVLGAASNVTVPGSGIAPAVLGIFLMRLGIYLDSKDKDLDDN